MNTDNVMIYSGIVRSETTSDYITLHT